MIEPRGDFQLDANKVDALAVYLSEHGWLTPGEYITGVTQAGEGNMNCTLRIKTDRRSFILKQSKPWVEKYPHIAAPEHRLLVEADFYAAVAEYPEISGKMPELLNVDRTNRIAQLQDLGETADFTSIYGEPSTIEDHLPNLCQWLAGLHKIDFSDEIKMKLVNREMRALNHEHLFHFPLLMNNSYDLDAVTPGLQKEGERLKRNREYVAEIEKLGSLYLRDGDILLHGDFFPGSWLKNGASFSIIDPEFAFFGPAEYDVGVMIGHLHMAGVDQRWIESVFNWYGGEGQFNRTLVMQFAGMEIMRRLMGVAQLSLPADLARKSELLRLSEKLVSGRI